MCLHLITNTIPENILVTCLHSFTAVRVFYSSAILLASGKNRYRARDTTSDENVEIENQCQSNEPVGRGECLATQV